MLHTSARFRRALGALSVVSAVLAALGSVAACGGTGRSDGKGPSREAPADAADSLEKLIVAEVEGFEVTGATAAEVRATDAVTASEAACQPIADLVGTVAAGSPSDTVYRQLIASSEPRDRTAPAVLVALSSYPRGGAARALAALGEAVSACEGGFTTTAADGEEGRDVYSEVEAENGPAGLDESLAFELTGTLDGERLPLKYTLVRTGDTVALFYAMNPFDPASVAIAPTVTAAQMARLM
ncbi:hypothetical protein ACFXP3_06290 [Streptomyces sp. NPDC059096]|uniref:hypothetical protein n=1 Tax=Streptomyces sp. NPDC059096 TaxID=3346727 RepID=UPI0036992869